jgi:hypothetical protein
MGQRSRFAARDWPVLAMGLALVLAGCSSSAPKQSPIASGVVPSPTDARVEIGSGGPGFDSGASLYAFTSSQAPGAALAGYARQLTGRGYVAIGTAQGWYLYRGSGMIVAVTVSVDGPPTDLLVRVATVQSGILDQGTQGGDVATGTSAPGGTTGGARVTAQPDQPSASPPGQAKGNPEPTGRAQPSPPGQNKGSSAPNGQGLVVAPGPAKPPPPHGGETSATTAP